MLHNRRNLSKNSQKALYKKASFIFLSNALSPISYKKDFFTKDFLIRLTKPCTLEKVGLYIS